MTPDTAQAPPKSRCSRCGAEDYDYEMFHHRTLDGITLVCGQCVDTISNAPEGTKRKRRGKQRERAEKIAVIRAYATSDMTYKEVGKMYNVSPTSIGLWIDKFRRGRLTDRNLCARSARNSAVLRRAEKLKLLEQLDAEAQKCSNT